MFKFKNSKENLEIFNKVKTTGLKHKIKILNFAIKGQDIYFDVDSDDGLFALLGVLDADLLPLFLDIVEDVNSNECRDFVKV